MKLVVEQKLVAGVPQVEIKASEFTPDEKVRISKFGSPIISLQPHSVFVNGVFVSSVPVHALNNVFRFKTQHDAQAFVDRITGEIGQKMKDLRARSDDFSASNTYDI